MSMFEELNSLMAKYGFRPKKKMAQYFITDESLIEKLIEEADLKPTDTVLEIGPGTGVLTRELLKKCKVVAVELDDLLFELLQEELPQKNLTLVHGDFLTAKIPKFNKIVSLPPYTISSKIMYRIFELGFEKAVLVFQHAFASKLTASEGFEEYCPLSILTRYYSTPKITGNVSPAVFFPKPRSPSAIISLTAEKKLGTVKNESLFREFIKAVFRYQNKNISNALSNAYPFLEKDFDFPLEEKEFLEKARKLELKNRKVNLISPAEFVQVFNRLVQ